MSNKEKLLKTSKEWQKNNKERASKHHVNYIRKRIKNDPIFKFKNIIRFYDSILITSEPKQVFMIKE